MAGEPAMSLADGLAEVRLTHDRAFEEVAGKGSNGFPAPGASTLWIGPGALSTAAERLAPWLAGRPVFVVAQPPVLDLHGDAFAALLAAADRRVDLPIPDGEAAKTLEVAGELWRRMLDSGGKRDSRLVTFGGGSAGDLGGFVAGAFLRGIEYVQVPTTLLAQVDAAIGGKTAVDLPAGKNTVGMFHHPAAVVSDTSVLATLPAGELRSGLVESIKMAYLLDGDLFTRIEENLDPLLAGDADALAPVVTASARAKVGVVESDVREGGRRKLLNFGHTLGHAIESALGYSGLRHGECVAYGMLFALRLAESRNLDRADLAAFPRLRRLLARLDLPPLPSLDPEDLVDRLSKDKKARESGLTWVLPEAVEPDSSHPAPAVGRFVTDLPKQGLLPLIEGFLAAPLAAL